jgi:hypothetical protein
MNMHRLLVAAAVLASLVNEPSAWAQDVSRAPPFAEPPLVTDRIVPAATGTVSLLPELGLFRRAPVGDAIQSHYFRTTAVNREFRRGFLEFSIPAFSGTLESATLVLTEQRARTTFPKPPDRHELSHYDADLVVSTGDYDTPTSPLAEFETDANSVEQRFSFDVTALTNTYKGRNLGLRIKLAVDPDYFGEGSRGSGVQINPQGSPARIVLVRSGTTEPLDPDSDEDGVPYAQDNCTLEPNPGQCDSDEDGYGNHCDGDLNNNGVTNARDGVILRNLLGVDTPGPRFSIGDFNCDGVVNENQDTTLFRPMLGQPPGPSGLAEVTRQR